jgi:signal peptidase I
LTAKLAATWPPICTSKTDFQGAIMEDHVYSRPSLRCRLMSLSVLALCVLLLIHCWGIESFVVPTGSMAPALAGHHREGICPRCGMHVLVGRHPDDKDGTEGADCYRHAFCFNCGYSPLPVGRIPEARGDQILVNKNVFCFRRPRRWEIIVFRLFGKIFVKRVVGLPGEWFLIEDGDVYINNSLVRKTLDEVKQVRILVFDNNYQSRPDGWQKRWEYKSGIPQPAPEHLLAEEAHGLQSVGLNEESENTTHHSPLTTHHSLLTHQIGKALILRAEKSPEYCHWLTYRNFSLDQGKVLPIRDEYAYNGGLHRGEESVHDFMLECDVEILKGRGNVSLAITDGHDALLAEIPAGTEGKVRLSRGPAGIFPPDDGRARWRQQEETSNNLGVSPPPTHSTGLRAGRSYHIELAFVDRRLTFVVERERVIDGIDLPKAEKRADVSSPIALGGRGIDVVFRNVRLYRDIHYTQAGRQGVHGQVVRLGPDQYFVMGDNSPNSEDSRYWPNQGVVPESNLVGKPFLIHWPSRVVWHTQFPDWQRLRWLR